MLFRSIQLMCSLGGLSQQPWNFQKQEIDTGLGVGYAVLAVDMNGDGAKDLVVADKQRILAYYHPDWKRKTLLEGGTAPDNVCIAARDIDGDGRMDLAVGAGWKPFDTKEGGTLQWLRQPEKNGAPWTLHPISSEPTLHRMRFARVGKNGEEELVVIPLMGRDSSAKANWSDGSPLRVLAFSVPAKPAQEPWPVRVLNQELHVAHNFDLISGAGGHDLAIASYEGISLLARQPGGGWRRELIHAGNQENPKSNRGASEVRRGSLAGGESAGRAVRSLKRQTRPSGLVVVAEALALVDKRPEDAEALLQKAAGPASDELAAAILAMTNAARFRTEIGRAHV